MNWVVWVYGILGLWAFFLRVDFSVRENIWLNFWYLVDIVVSSICFFGGMYGAVKNMKSTGLEKSYWLSILLVIITLMAVFTTMSFNAGKKVMVGYDAIALYEARAKYMENGVKFKDMDKLSEFDVINKDFYSLYPPFTSMTHYYWEKWLPNINVSVVYSVFLIFLFLILIGNLGSFMPKFAAILFTYLIILNPIIYGLSLVEYTNLPFAVFFIGGVLFVASFLQERKNYKLFLSGFFLSASVWTRHIEPLWLGVVLALFVSDYSNWFKNKNWLYLCLLTLAPLLTYWSWRNFVVGLTEQNYIVSFGGNAVIMAIKGLFDGSFFNVISVMFVSWVAVLPLLLSSLLITVNNETDKRILLFLKMTEVVCILIYVGGIYLFSFQGYWWVGMAKDSLVRSSSCLIVIPLLIFGIKLKEYAKKYIR